jgi:hypothetical protein
MEEANILFGCPHCGQRGNVVWRGEVPTGSLCAYRRDFMSKKGGYPVQDTSSFAINAMRSTHPASPSDCSSLCN